MSDIDTRSNGEPDDQPTLSELLGEETRTGTDVSDGATTLVSTDVGPESDVSMLHDDDLPTHVAKLLTTATFSEPVSEELDWLIADGALLPATTRKTLLAAVDRALRLRRASDKVQGGPDDPFMDVPDEFDVLAAELRDLLRAVENGGITASEFAPLHVSDLVLSAAIDPVEAFVAFRRSIWHAQSIRQDQVPVLGSHSSHEWENQLEYLRRLLLHRRRSDPSSGTSGRKG